MTLNKLIRLQRVPLERKAKMNMKQINAEIKILSRMEGGKVDMDAPMWRAALKTIALRMATDESFSEFLANYAFDTKAKAAKSKRKK